MTELPVQLRIGFDVPIRDLRMRLRLNGMQVQASASDGDDSGVYQHLAAVGVSVVLDSRHGPTFPVRELPLLAALPAQVSLETNDADMCTLVEVVRYSRPGQPPVVVRADTPDLLNVSWEEAGRMFNEPLRLACAPALVAMGVPIIAPDGTWEALLSASSLPQVIAHARMNLDGYIEIRATAPQRLELSPIDPLFRIDDALFGAPLSALEQVLAIPGVLWQGDMPNLDVARRSSYAHLPMDLQQELDRLLPGLTRSRGRVVQSPDPTTRRVLCAAASAAMDAYPLVIIAPPSALWLWSRVLESFGVRSSMVDPSSPAMLLTYEQFAQSAGALTSPAGLIFDDLDRAVVETPQAARALHRFDGLPGAVRLACVEGFPAHPDDQIEFMSCVRPGEFRSGVPAVVRYPPDSRRRLSAHITPYAHEPSAPLRQGVLGQAIVHAVDVPEGIVQELDRLAGLPEATLTLTEKMLSVLSGGAPSVVSPKVTVAYEIVARCVRERRSVALVCAHARTAEMLHALTRTLGAKMASSETSAHADSVTIHVLGREVPIVQGFDEVVFVDYPLSARTLDAVSQAAAGGAPPAVRVLHARHALDDRMAVIAAARREQSATMSASPLGAAGLSAVEASFVLGQ